MENPHLENFLDPLRNNGVEESPDDNKLRSLGRWVGGGGAQRGCHMWKGYRLMLPANMKDEATVIKAYKIVRGTESMFTDINVRELPVLEKYVCSLPQQMQNKCLLLRQAAVCSYQQSPFKPGSVSTESPPSERNIKTVEAKTVHWLFVSVFLCSTPQPQSPFLLTLPKGALFNYFHWLPVVSDYLAGFCTLFTPLVTDMDIVLISSAYLILTDNCSDMPAYQFLTFLQVTLALAGE